MSRLHPRMESAATTCTIAPIMEHSFGEMADFDVVVRLYWPRIFRFALASLRDRDAAQTVAQDCFLKAWRGRARFRGEASLQTWLMQIAINLVRDYARNQRLRFWRKATVYPVDAEVLGSWIPDRRIDSERQVLVKEQVDAVWRATARLSERQRTVFLLRHVEDMEILEIAAVTRLTEGAVKVHLDRAVRSLRKHLGRFR